MSDKIGMVRAKTKDGREVVGWYVRTLRDGTHWIIQDDVYIQFDRYVQHEDRNLYPIDSTHLFEIDISIAAVATGKLDKNDEMIFGSRGEMQGGDTVQASEGGLTDATEVYWNKENVWWALGVSTLGSWKSDNLEIIKPEEGK